MNSLGNVVLNDRELENQRLELTDPKANYILGPNLTLRGCSLVLKVSAQRLSFKQPRFIDCTFDVKQELKNHQGWVAASLQGCRFKGRLTGCDFGHWPEFMDLPWYQHGSIQDCDFTEARMTGCRILRADPATLRFPRWPCFTILDPRGRSPALNRVQWPGRIGPVVIQTLAEQPPGTVALIEDAAALAKRFDTTPQELRAVLEKFDGIVY